MTRHYSSNAVATTLSAGINDSTTSISVGATTGFPAVDFVLALDYGAAEQELVLVTNVSGTTLTVTRGYDSTTAQAHSLGAVVRHVHAAIDFRDSRTHEAATTGVHGVTGSFVGTTDTQALTNKDLSSGTNTFPATHVTTAGTQTLSNKDLSSGTNTFPSSLATDAEVATAVSDHATVTATHGATGAVVGTTNTQTLTNKTLTSPTINTPTIDDPTFTGDFVGGVRYIEKGSDEPLSNSTTFQDDDSLQFTVEANAVYEATITARFTGTVNTGGLKWQLVGPAGTTGGTFPSFDLTATPFASRDVAPSGTSGDPFFDGSEDSPATTYRIKTAGTAGSVKLQWAQHTAHATGITCKAGSFISVRRVG